MQLQMYGAAVCFHWGMAEAAGPAWSLLEDHKEAPLLGFKRTTAGTAAPATPLLKTILQPQNLGS